MFHLLFAVKFLLFLNPSRICPKFSLTHFKMNLKNMFVKPNFLFRDNWLKTFAAIWAFVLITPLIYFPGPSALFGHPWKVELTISLIFCLFLSCYLFIWKKDEFTASISPNLVRNVLTPCFAFISWSAASAFWASSTLSVAHHTLVWADYLVFFLFALFIASNKKLFKISVISLGSVISIICLSCIFEFILEERPGETFGFRYSRFAEIFAALLPLFFSFTLRLKRKHFIWSVFVTLVLWLALMFTTSRGSLVSAIIGMSVFVVLRILTDKSAAEKKRFIFVLAGLIFVFILTQIPLLSSNEQKASTFSRITTQAENDPGNSLSGNIRFLFAGVGKEMFFDNYLVGVGADNFGLEFNKYRAVFSANPRNKSTAGMQEELLPERAHNEYLQILSELGIVGAGFIFCLFLGMAKLGFLEIKRNRSERGSILTHAAIGGISAFLISSSFSSFSFRLMQNGLIFFFLVAILLRNYVVRKQEVKSSWFIAPRLRKAFVLVALTGCSSLFIFSGLKATSQFLVYTAENEADFETAKTYYAKAVLLDKANGSANYSLGLRLLAENSYLESAAELQRAIDKGINTPVCYSYLISSYTLANQIKPALKTNSDAIEIFPYSVFLRVRYASLLKRFDRLEESEKQMEIAEQLNKKQAETWWLLINNGASRVNENFRVNKEILSLEELKPNSAVYAVLTERQIVYPNEKPKFNF